MIRRGAATARRALRNRKTAQAPFNSVCGAPRQHDMTKKAKISNSEANLRRRAETRLRKRRGLRGSESGSRKSPDAGNEAGDGAPRSEADWRRLPHELQVHQVELEMQNAELLQARDNAEVSLEKYADLYDFAPVGYFSLNEKSVILEVNLTGANMLGADRSRLLNRCMRDFVVPGGRESFQRFLEAVFVGTGKKVCEATLLNGKGATFWAELQAVRAVASRNADPWCRVAISDVTIRKQVEEAQRQSAALTITNRELQREIVRREAVEQALKRSEKKQSLLLKRSLEMQKQLRRLSHKVLYAQEEERKRISRELHDEITQTLVSISIHMENLNREAKIDVHDLKTKIARTQRLVEKSVDIVHRFARELRPAALDHLGLTSALLSHMRDFMKRTGIRAQFTTFTGVDKLDGDLRTALYRVAQSALTNVEQHARASRVEVNIEDLGGSVGLTIQDDGVSFNAQRALRAGKSNRLGLLGMRERVEMVGGTFKITSRPGQGTTVNAVIPYGKNVRGKNSR